MAIETWWVISIKLTLLKSTHLACLFPRLLGLLLKLGNFGDKQVKKEKVELQAR